MYNGVIETANKLKEQQKELSTKRESEDRTLSQTDLINKTNVEVAKHLIRFMHEYMTSIEVKNLPENLAKTDDISKMLKSLDDLIVSQTVTTNDLAEDLNSGIEDLIMAVEELKQVSTDKSEDAEYTEKVCEELRSVQTAITKANTAVLKGDKTKDVVSAVKALEKAVKGLEMAPVVNVAPAEVDLSGIEEKIAEIPVQTAITNANTAVLKGDKTKDVVSAVKALEKAVKGLEMAPVVNVAPAEVDLSGIEEKIAEIPGKIKIPETVIPENDYSALEQAVRDVQSSIDNLIFPVAEFPTTVKVTNTDGTAVGGSTANYITKIDDTTTTNMIYIGKAALTGSAVATSAAVWQIKRIDTSTLAMDKKWAAGTDAFNQVWDNRATSITYN